MKRCPKAGNKKKYPDTDAAITAAVRNSTKYGKPFRIYQCQPNPNNPPHWHLSTKPERKP